MRNRNLVVVLTGLILVLVVALFISCDVGSQERGTSIGAAGGAVGYGETYLVPALHVGYPAYIIDMTVENVGETSIGYHSIADITDMDSPNWHQGYLSISYADQTTSFALESGETYPFTITMGVGAPVGIYQMEVGILNKNDIAPNPYIFRVRVQVVP
jgi:hypothetical protein